MNASELDADKIRGIVEALLMTADQPVTPGRLLGLLKGLNGKDLRQAVDDLNERYRTGGHAMSIVEVAGGFQLATHKEYGPWVRKFHDRGQVRLSQAALEALAIVAFKQPVSRVEVDSIRGVDSSGVMRTLFEANMVRMVGRSEGVGRPMLFGTTREFMVHFGLKSLADLPKPKELEELLAEGARKHRAAAGAEDPGEESRAQATRAQEGETVETVETVEAVEIDPVDAVDPDTRHQPSRNGDQPSPAVGDDGEEDGPEGGTPDQSS